MKEKLEEWWNKVTYKRLKLYLNISSITTLLGFILLVELLIVSWVVAIIFAFLVGITLLLLFLCIAKGLNESNERIYKDQLLQIEEVFGDKERIDAKCFVEFNKKSESLTLCMVVDGSVAKEFRDFPYDLFLEYFGDVCNYEKEE